MKRLISGLFSSISDAELFAAMMGEEHDTKQTASSTVSSQTSEITAAYDNAQEQGEE